MEEVKKQTPIDLYLMVPHQVYEGGKQSVKVCLLACKKIKAFAGFLPTKEILETHFQAERVRIEMAKQESGNENTYRPQPLYLEVESSIFASIVSEARAKDKALGTPDVLALTLGNSMPCCLITVSKEEPEKAAPKPKQVRKRKTKKIEEKHD